ncbi:MAG TPA: AAA family ATPase [Polyangia bacterium]|nr:AAA family ATPase [Polyangia bacterium]
MRRALITAPRGGHSNRPAGLVFAGYEVEQQVHEGHRTIVYDGVRQRDGAPVVIKCLKNEYPTPDEIARLRNEYEITRLIKHRFVVTPIEDRTDGDHHYLVFGRFDGLPLASLSAPDAPDLGKTLSLALLLLEGLGAIHQEGIVHKNLNPTNILITADETAIQIIDFGIASRIGVETQDVVSPDALEGSLGYISPEQTGRMNRPVDYRSDFYAIGAILFERLVGAPVFEPRDPLALVYDHIARRPVFPEAKLHLLPESLRAIVLKLLAKTPEDRYQSTGGITADLRRCLHELRETGQISGFSPGKNDASDRFQLPHRLYGRQRETERIMAAFDRASAGEKRLLMVSGPSGIGKSALVQEVQKPIAATRGYFVSGKCEALNRNIPHAVFAQAFRDLVRQLNTESPESLGRWRQSIADALGPNGQVILDVVPELESIIGPQAPVSPLDPEDSQLRFSETFCRFVRVFCQFGHPLVLFIDDLHWIDTAGLRLLRAILLDTQIAHLLVVCSYRDDEAGGAHPMMRLVDDVSQAGNQVETIPVTPLDKVDVTQLISDVLGSQPQEVAALGDVVCERCDGNPFFVSQYLEYLHREHIIRFVHATGSWTWDATPLQEGNVSEGIAELMRAKIMKAPRAIQETLHIAACIGSRFDLRMLSIVSGKSRPVLAEELRVALGQGFVTLIGGSYQLFQDTSADATVVLRFVHDRVQQAAHDMLAAQARKGIHLGIARLLMRGMANASEGDNLFEVVNHLNQAWDLLTSEDDRLTAIALNLRAGIRAKVNRAYDVATASFREAMAHLPAQAWRRHYDIASRLYLERAECEYLAGNLDGAEKLLDEAFAHLRTKTERAAVYAIKIPMRTNRGQPAEAIRLGIEALQMFGITIAATPAPATVTEAILEIGRRLSGLSSEQLLGMPPMIDRETLSIMRLLNRLATPAYFTDQGLYWLMHCLVIKLTLEHGHASESVRGYSVYGMILGSEFASFEEGTRYGELAIQLSDRLDNVQMKGVSRVLHGCFIAHWTRSADDSLRHLLDGHQFLREAGNIVLASFALCFHAATMWIKGEPLDRVRADASQNLEYLRRVQYREMISFMECINGVAASLAGRTRSPLDLDGDGYNEVKAVTQMGNGDIKTPLHWYVLSKMQLHYLFGDLDGAQEMAERSEQLLPHSRGSLLTSEHHFFQALIALGLGTGGSSDAPGAADKSRRLLQSWAASSPDNFAAKHLLVEAESARVAARHEQAMDFYDRAIAEARNTRNLFVEALGNELAGRYYLSRQRTFIAGAYLKQARYGYSRWGAIAKVDQMGQEHAALLGGGLRRSSSETRRLDQVGTAGGAGQDLDVAAIMKSARDIGEVIVLDRLVKKVTRTLVESAGAQMGALLFAGPEGLRVVARRHIDDNEDAVLVDTPLESYPDLPALVVRKVMASQSSVLYEDASKSPELRGDPYVQRTSPRSILCFPAMHQGRLGCIVYLENNLGPGVFTRERVEVLRILSAQAAISIDNARLYAGLEEKVHQLQEAQIGLREGARLVGEMEIARRIQTCILPRTLEVAGLEIAAIMKPTTEVGGDYYDVIPVDGGCWIGIGDVAGHGLPTGLVMLMIQSALAALAREEPAGSPRQLLQVLNRVLYENIRKRLAQQEHATLSLLRLETNGRITFAGAHEDFIVWRAQERRCELVSTSGIWMGAIPEIPATMIDQELQLMSGDILVLYTDGAIEGRNAAREQLGLDRLCKELVKVTTQSVDVIRDHLLAVIEEWTFQQDDDITLVVARYHG